MIGASLLLSSVMTKSRQSGAIGQGQLNSKSSDSNPRYERVDEDVHSTDRDTAGTASSCSPRASFQA